MYLKEKIDQLFAQYVKTGRLAHLEALLMECGKVVGVVVSKSYPDFSTYKDDVCQEVLMRMLINFRNRNRLCQELVNPRVFIFSKMRSHLFTVMRALSQELGIPFGLTDRERQVLDARDGQGLTFEQIARELGLQLETVKVYYSFAQGKLDQHVIVPDSERAILEQSENTELDPAKQYELKELKEHWRLRIIEAAKKHPNICKHRSTMKAFVRSVDDIVGRDMDDCEEES